MPSQKNIDIVASTTEKFEKSQGIYFTKYTGMDVPKITSLRKSFSENSVEFTVIKNTLTKIASKNAGLDGKFDDILSGQIGIAFSEDPVAPARVIKDFKKQNEDDLEILGVYFDGELYGADKYQQLATLPSKVSRIVFSDSLIGTAFFSLLSLLEIVITSLFKSRKPISTRNGTPFISHSLNLNPGDIFSRSSK